MPTTDRSLTQRVQDVPFVALGAGDAAVGFVRSLPEQLARLPEHVRGTVDDLADRGRGLRGDIRRDPAVRQAKRQTSTAKSRAKAASTSASKAVGAQVKAAEKAAAKVG